jgi:dCMP deaminase
MRRQERPEKYYWFEHAERNAIYNAVRVGIPLKGCRMYVLGVPCMDCARAIVQSGIEEVIVHDAMTIKYEKWEEHHKRTMVLFLECGVKIRLYRGKIITEITARMKGDTYTLNE